MVTLYHRLTRLSTNVANVSTDSFGHWLARQLDRREWKAADLARRLDVRPGVVSHWLRDQRTPSTPSCERIADVLRVDIDTVLEKAGHRPSLEPLAADDPRRELMGMLRRIDFTGNPDWEELIRKDLEMLLDWQRRLRAEAGS